MKFGLLFILFLLVLPLSVKGQDTSVLQGEVSFTTSNNIYVKFKSTADINIGDTLVINSSKKACLIVNSKSSISVVCSVVEDCLVKVKDIINFYPSKSVALLVSEEIKVDQDKVIPGTRDTIRTDVKEKQKSGDIRGRISLANYSSISSERENLNRLVARFSFSANHINNSKFSVETYLNYTQYNYADEKFTQPHQTNFNVYNLAIRYDLDSTLSFTLGRKINSKASSLGPVDGLQVEKYFGSNYVGIIAGSKPDINNFHFNPALLEYGGYIGKNTYNKKFYSQTSLGFVEQRNSGEIDRRYTFLQHSSTIFSKLSIFSSVELDLYSKVDSVVTNNLRLTNFYISARYRINRRINVSLSYDSRKRIIYYETYQSEVDRMLDDDLARQGLRARVNIKPAKYINVGVSYSKRFQSDLENKSNNIYGYLSFSKIPLIKGRISIAYNRNISNYLENNIGSVHYYRSFIENKLYTDIYYRMVNYSYVSDIPDFNQNYFGANLSYYITRKLVFSVSGEMAEFSLENNYRVNARIIKRFRNQ